MMVRVLVSFWLWMKRTVALMASVANTAMIATTTSSSMSVKPFRRVTVCMTVSPV